MKSNIVIAGTPREIWAINPESKKMLNIHPNYKKMGYRKTMGEYRIIGIQPTLNSIYHAYEIQKRIAEGDDIVDINFVQIGNSLSRMYVKSIFPQNTEKREKYSYGFTRMVNLDFRFQPNNYELNYYLNGASGNIFPNTKGIPDTSTSELWSEDGVIFDGEKEIAELNGNALYLHKIGSGLFLHMLRKHNKKLYKNARHIK